MEEAIFDAPIWLQDMCWTSILMVLGFVFIFWGTIWILYSAYEKENK